MAHRPIKGIHQKNYWDDNVTRYRTHVRQNEL
jgi:hypothetical protein